MALKGPTTTDYKYIFEPLKQYHKDDGDVMQQSEKLEEVISDVKLKAVRTTIQEFYLKGKHPPTEDLGYMVIKEGFQARYVGWLRGLLNNAKPWCYNRKELYTRRGDAGKSKSILQGAQLDTLEKYLVPACEFALFIQAWMDIISSVARKKCTAENVKKYPSYWLSDKSFAVSEEQAENIHKTITAAITEFREERSSQDETEAGKGRDDMVVDMEHDFSEEERMQYGLPYGGKPIVIKDNADSKKLKQLVADMEDEKKDLRDKMIKACQKFHRENIRRIPIKAEYCPAKKKS